MSKTQELIKQLQDGIRDLFESDKYKAYLKFMSSFHSYSASNCLLIFQQMPEATLCASYSDWNQKHHRQVKKGSKALRVLAPHTYKEKDEKGEEHERLGFHCASCFDVSQTFSIDGTPLPELCRDIDADVCGFADLLDILISVSPVPVAFEKIKGDVHGYFSPTDLRIAVKKGMSEAQTISTLLHEQAHAWLHAKGAEEEDADKRTKEVEAQSIAYVVSQMLGIEETDEYSFAYVSGWSSDKSTPELRASLEIIRKTSDMMYGLIEEKLHELHQGSNDA